MRKRCLIGSSKGQIFDMCNSFELEGNLNRIKFETVMYPKPLMNLKIGEASTNV